MSLAIFIFMTALAAEVSPAAEDTPMVATEHAGKNGRTLTDEQRAYLASMGWYERAGDGVGVWVCIRDQTIRLVDHQRVVWETPCSTAAKGIGYRVNSFQTPLGWHSVAEKLGDGAPVGQVFRDKRATNEICKPGDKVSEDLVLTRVLVLTGEEPGKNKGGDMDSYARNIYIHGTNAEQDIGKPASHGCVRLSNKDVIAAYERIPVGTFVLITE